MTQTTGRSKPANGTDLQPLEYKQAVAILNELAETNPTRFETLVTDGQGSEHAKDALRTVQQRLR